MATGNHQLKEEFLKYKKCKKLNIQEFIMNNLTAGQVVRAYMRQSIFLAFILYILFIRKFQININ